MPPRRTNKQNTQDEVIRPTHGIQNYNQSHTLGVIVTQKILLVPISQP